MKKLMTLILSVILLTGCFEKESGENENTYVANDETLLTYVIEDGYVTEYTQISLFNAEENDVELDYYITGMEQLCDYMEMYVYYSCDLDDEHSFMLTTYLLKMDVETDFYNVIDYGTLTVYGIEEEEFLENIISMGYEKK